MSVRWVLTAVVAGALASVTGSARAQDLDAALDLESRGQLAGALRAFEHVLSTPGNSTEDLATIYQHLGLLRFADGDEQGARQALMWLLTVAPDATLPGSAPPEVQEILEASRDRWAGRRLHAVVETAVRASWRNVRVGIRAADDVALMVEAVEVMDGEAVVAEAEGRGPWELAVPGSVFESGRALLQVRLIDEHGGLLWDGGIDVEVEGSTGGRDGGQLSPRARRILAWSLVGAGGLLVVIGGVAVGVDGTSTGNYRVVDGILEQEVRATATGGWVLISTGLAAAVAGVVLLILTPRERGGAGLGSVALRPLGEPGEARHLACPEPSAL
jgi:hypothetical protein